MGMNMLWTRRSDSSDFCTLTTYFLLRVAFDIRTPILDVTFLCQISASYVLENRPCHSLYTDTRLTPKYTQAILYLWKTPLGKPPLRMR